MGSITFKPVIYSQYKRKDGTYPVRIRITANRQSRFLSTNITVTKDSLTRGLSIKDDTVNSQLRRQIDILRSAASKLNLFAIEQMTIDEIVSFLIKEGASRFELDFPDYAERYYPKLGKGWKNYRSAVRSLSAFIGKEHYDISVITSSLLVRWEEWLRNKHGESARAVSLYTQSVSYIHSLARKEYNDEELDIIKIRNPFSKYSCPEQKEGEHRNAPPALINLMLLMREDLSGRERMGVDAFLLSFAMMGINVPDMYEAVKPINGVVTYFRQKTTDRRADRAEMRVRIEPSFMWLVDEYAGSKGRLFSFSERYSTYQNFGTAANLGLHQFEKRLGLKQPLTMYVARHTWATAARSSACNIDKSTVNDCICHVEQGMKMTDIYAEKDWGVMWEANKKVQNLFAWH